MGRFSWIADLFDGEDEDGSAGGGSKNSGGSKSSAGGGKTGGGQVKPKRKGRFNLGETPLKSTIPFNASGPMIEDVTPTRGPDLTIGGLIPGIPSNASGPMIEDVTPWGSAAAPLPAIGSGTNQIPVGRIESMIRRHAGEPYDPSGNYARFEKWPPNSVATAGIPPTSTPLYPVPPASRFGLNFGDATFASLPGLSGQFGDAIRQDVADIQSGAYMALEDTATRMGASPEQIERLKANTDASVAAASRYNPSAGTEMGANWLAGGALAMGSLHPLGKIIAPTIQAAHTAGESLRHGRGDGLPRERAKAESYADVVNGYLTGEMGARLAPKPPPGVGYQVGQEFAGDQIGNQIHDVYDWLLQRE